MITHDPFSSSSDPSRLPRQGTAWSTRLWEALRTSGAGPFRQHVPASVVNEGESNWGSLEVDVVQAELLACKIESLRLRFLNRQPFDRTRVESWLASVNCVLHNLTIIEYDTTHEQFVARTRPERLLDPSASVTYYEMLGSPAELTLHRYLRAPRHGAPTMRTQRSTEPYTWTEEMFTNFVNGLDTKFATGY